MLKPTEKIINCHLSPQNRKLDESSDSNAIARSSPAELACLHPSSMLLALAFGFTPIVLPQDGFYLL